MLGQARIAITLDHYGHVMPAIQLEATAVIESILSP